ncbi:testis-specific gene A8 protein-like [Corvus hawaiiensis]|uniref:testis-specific gene A8 protein-like n=1 Tax=Corvus hawaiiensis TaxID=134902 RepID=UPI002018BBD6|nr:testis-specific gene A8 protein-like [Corvus hawaiiensis]
MPEPLCRARRTEPTPPAPPAGAVAPNQEMAWPAANPEAALLRENPEAAAATERRPGAAAPGTAAEHGPATVPSAAGEHETGAVLAATAPNAARVQETIAAPSAAVAPEMAAAASVPVWSGLAKTASCKEAAVQTAAQPTVCTVCSASSELSQSAPLRPFLFAPSTSELPLPDDSSSGSEADEVLAPGR